MRNSFSFGREVKVISNLFKRLVGNCENGKYIGTSIGETSPEAISYWHELGVDMISAGSDFRFLQMLTETTFQTLKNEHREK